jgi:hypothetical protein
MRQPKRPWLSAVRRTGGTVRSGNALVDLELPPRERSGKLVDGQVAVPGGGQVKVPAPRVDQVLFRVVPFLALASRMR